MTRYRKVSTRIWSDENFRKLGELSKFVFLYLLTNPSLTMLGAMRTSVPGLAAEIGMDLRKFTVAFDSLVSAAMVRFDKEASFLLLPNFMRHNKPENPNVVKHWPEVFEALPECGLRAELADKLANLMETLPESFRDAFAKSCDISSGRVTATLPEEVPEELPHVFTQPFPKQEQEQEQEPEPEQEQEQSSLSKTRATSKHLPKKRKLQTSKTNGLGKNPSSQARLERRKREVEEMRKAGIVA